MSYQTISKWERGDTYPDIATLPEIAAFFGVPIEEMPGLNNTRREQKINEYLALFDEMHFKKSPLLFDEYCRAVKEFPGDYRILVRYMQLLFEEKDDVFDADYNKTSSELMSIYGNIQNYCTHDGIRIWSKRIIIEHLMKKYECTHDKNGRYYFDKDVLKKAEDIVSTLPSLCDTRECLTLRVSNDALKRKDAMEEMTYLLQNSIISYCYYPYDNDFTPQYKIEVIEAMNRIIKMVDSDNYISKNRVHLIYNYGHLGHLYCEMGDYERAVEYLKLFVQCAKEFDRHPVEAEKIFRFYETENRFKEWNMRERAKRLMTEAYPLSDEFKSTEGFKAILKMLDE